MNQALFKNDTDVVVVEIISLENSSCWILTPMALKDGAFVDIMVRLLIGAINEAKVDI